MRECGVGRTVGSGRAVEANYAVGWPDGTHAIMRERGVGRAVGAYAEGRAPDAPTHSQFLIIGRNTSK